MRYAGGITFCLALLFAGLPTHQISAQDLTGVVDDVLPNVVTLVAYSPSGRAIGQGSGFVMSDGRIATNLHVVAGASWLEVLDSEGVSAGTIGFAEVLSSRADLAILPAIPGLGGGLSLSDNTPGLGSRVAVIGSPQGLESTVSDGLVSGRRDIDGVSVLQISAPISPGSSGGPVVDFRGEVVAIAVSQLTTGQNLNFAVPASELRALMRSPPGRSDLAELAAPEHSGVRTSDLDDALEALRDLPRLKTGSPIVGGLAPGDLKVEGRYEDWYRIDVAGGDSMSIAMASDDLDAHLGVFSEQRFSAWIASDSDSLGLYQWSNDDFSNTNAAVEFTPARDGILYVVASSYDVGEQGEYQIGLFPGSLEDLLAMAESAAAPTQEVDDRWVYSSSFAADSTLVDVYWDGASLVELSDATYEVWFMWDYDSPAMTSDGDRVDEIRALWEVNCERRQMQQLEWYRYLNNEEVSSQTSSNRPTRPIPGSVGEGMLEAVCPQ